MGKELVQDSSPGVLLEAFYNLDKNGKDGVIAAFREAADLLSYPVLEFAFKNNENDRVRNAAWRSMSRWANGLFHSLFPS